MFGKFLAVHRIIPVQEICYFTDYRCKELSDLLQSLYSTDLPFTCSIYFNSHRSAIKEDNFSSADVSQSFSINFTPDLRFKMCHSAYSPLLPHLC